MGVVRKIGDEYYIEFYARGLLYQQKAGRDKAKAQALLDEVESKIQQGEMGTIVRDVDLDVFWETFKRHAVEKYPQATYARFEQVLSDFQQFQQKEFPDLQKLSAITPRVMERYRLWLEQTAGVAKPLLKKKTLNFRLYMIREVWKYAITLGYLNDNPALHTKFFSDRSVAPAPFSVEQQKTLLSCIGISLEQSIQFMLATGILLEELVQLKWDDVNVQEKMIRVRKPLCSRKIVGERVVPIDYRAQQVLEECKRRENGPYIFSFENMADREKVVSLVREKIDACIEKYGTGYSIYTLRHTFVHDVLKKGLDLLDLNRLLGYCDIACVMRYR